MLLDEREVETGQTRLFVNRQVGIERQECVDRVVHRARDRPWRVTRKGIDQPGVVPCGLEENALAVGSVCLQIDNDADIGGRGMVRHERLRAQQSGLLAVAK
jgi:hypothetical protein